MSPASAGFAQRSARSPGRNAGTRGAFSKARTRAPSASRTRARTRLKAEFINRSGSAIDHRAHRGFLAALSVFLEPPQGDLTVLFCGDEEIKTLNLAWRGKGRPTDVLSFPGSGATAEGRTHIGDIAISVDTAARQARRARRPLMAEIQMLLAHGLLHCLGYDHETDDGTMMKLQADALRRARMHRRGR